MIGSYGGIGASGVEMSAVCTRSPDVILRFVAGEHLLVPIRSGLADMRAIYMINPVGACIWEQLDGARSLEAVLAAVLDRFDVSAAEARADIAGFVEQLQGSGLIERCS